MNQYGCLEKGWKFYNHLIFFFYIHFKTYIKNMI